MLCRFEFTAFLPPCSLSPGIEFLGFSGLRMEVSKIPESDFRETWISSANTGLFACTDLPGGKPLCLCFAYIHKILFDFTSYISRVFTANLRLFHTSSQQESSF